MPKLRRYFFDASAPECSKDTNVFKPAIAFEVHNGLSGIAGHYQFPTGATPTAFEQSAAHLKCWQYYADPRTTDFKIVRISDPDAAVLDRMQNTWKKLVNLNPSLSIVQPDADDPLLLTHAIFGAAALFNPDDIRFFVGQIKSTGRWDVAKILLEDPAYKTLMDDVKRKSKFYVGWVPAEKTLLQMQKILQP